MEKFARQEAAKAAMNHMRWGLQAQVPAASCTLLCAHSLLKPFAPTPNPADLESVESLLTHAQYKHAASCARGGVFGCGGRDFSSDYGHVHQGNAVVFM